MKHPLSLDGRSAVVIGGTSGIGRALALGLAEAGANVAATGRRESMVYEVADAIAQRGRRTLRQTADATDRKTLEVLLTRAEEAFGAVDILVNAAGRIQRAPTVSLPLQDWEEILAVNLVGTLQACQVFGAHMLGRGYGRVINITSLNSFVALHEVAAYAASKSAVASLTRSLAVEWAKGGVTVNAIAPGVFPTELNRALLHGSPRGRELEMRIPMGRFGQADELVGAAIYLASDAASYTTGTTVVVDGGFLSSGVNQ